MEDKKKSTNIVIRCSPELKELVTIEAKKENRTLTNFVETSIKEARMQKEELQNIYSWINLVSHILGLNEIITNYESFNSTKELIIEKIKENKIEENKEVEEAVEEIELNPLLSGKHSFNMEVK